MRVRLRLRGREGEVEGEGGIRSRIMTTMPTLIDAALDDNDAEDGHDGCG